MNAPRISNSEKIMANCLEIPCTNRRYGQGHHPAKRSDSTPAGLALSRRSILIADLVGGLVEDVGLEIRPHDGHDPGHQLLHRQLHFV